MRDYRPRPTRWDALVAAAIVLLAAASAGIRAGWGPKGAAVTAVVSVGGEEADRVALSSLRQPEVRMYSGRGYTVWVEFSPDAVRVTEADCPNQDCVHTGTVRGAGGSVVCLPARITVYLSGDQGVDAVLG